VPLCKGLAIPNAQLSRIFAVSAVLILATSICLGWKLVRFAKRSDPRAIDLPYALFCLLSAFLNAWCWEHYLVLIVHPLMVLAVTIARLWQDSFRRWCDEELSHEAFGVRSLPVVAGLSSIALVVGLLRVDMQLKMIMPLRYLASPTPLHHWQLHYFEAQASMPWIIAIVLCMATMPFVSRAARRGQLP
jgi:hypothetical protein